MTLRPALDFAVLAGVAPVGLAAMFGPSLVLGLRVQVIQVAPSDLVRTVVATGRVEAPHRVTIGSQMVVTVMQVPVEEGQAVQAGQLLIHLDDAELRAVAREADVAVSQAQARLRQLKEVQRPVAAQALRQAQATMDNASAQLASQEDLFRQGYAVQAALDEARKSVALGDAQVASARKQLDATEPGGSDEAVALTALAQSRANVELALATALCREHPASRRGADQPQRGAGRRGAAGQGTGAIQRLRTVRSPYSCIRWGVGPCRMSDLSPTPSLVLR